MTTKRILHILTAYVTLHLCSCGGDNQESDLTTGRFPNTALKGELADASPRFKDSTHKILYSEGGVMMMHCNGDNGDTISLSHIDSGSEIKLCWKGELKKGIVNNAQLHLDGVMLTDTEINIVKINSSGVWISFRTPDEDNCLLVVTP